MADRKKTIERLKGLQILSESSGSMGVFILPDLIRETLELLEEQEPVAPQYKVIFGDRVAFCGNCDTYLGKVTYCPKCGRKVKWDA